jgi:hypothetical protein
MAELRSKTPRENYATRTSEGKPNIGHPGTAAERTSDAARAAVELAADDQAMTVTAIDGTTLRANVDAAMVAQGATACNNAGARAAIAATITDTLLRTQTVQTVAPSVTIPAAR